MADVSAFIKIPDVLVLTILKYTDNAPYGHPTWVSRFARTCRRYYDLVCVHGLLRAGSWKNHLHMKALYDTRYKYNVHSEYRINSSVQTPQYIEAYMYDIPALRKNVRGRYLDWKALTERLDVWTILENKDLPWELFRISEKLRPCHLKLLSPDNKVSLATLSGRVRRADVERYPKLQWDGRYFKFAIDFAFMAEYPEMFLRHEYYDKKIWEFKDITSDLLIKLAKKNHYYLQYISGYNEYQLLDVLREVKFTSLYNCKPVRDPNVFAKMVHIGVEMDKIYLSWRQISENPKVLGYYTRKYM